MLIDPDVTTRTFKSNYIDTYVYEGDSASSARANETTMIVGNNGGKIHYSYLKILDIPELPGLNYRLRNIKLYIPTKKAGNQKLNLYEVTQPWNPNTITYANQPSSELIVSGASMGQINLSSWEDSKLEEWVNISAFFQSSSWNGFKIAHTANVENDYTEIYTSESSTSRPYMYFEYIHVPVESIKDNAVYSFVNSASGKYLTVHNGLTDNGTNIYQYTKNNTLSQAFRLSYNSIYDYFYIRSMCDRNGSNSLLRFNYGNDVSETGYTYTNVYLEEEYDNADINTEWLIVPHGNNDLFKVVSAADPNLALTAYGTANGTASGTTNTSAGNVFVSRFTGASNQLWKLESGGCQVLNYTEDIRDVTQPKTVSESSTTLKFGLLVENFGDYISWASTNTAVAAIDSSGKVTAKKAGTARIYTHIYYADGGEAEYSVTVYVTLANKTYYINNVDNNFRIEYENMTDLSENAVLEVYNSGTDEPTNRSRMFKIKHLGNSVYSIRSMLDNSMGWTNVSGNLVMTTIGTSDSSIPANAKWKINSNSNGYCFVSMASSQGHAVTSPASSGGNLTVNSYSVSANQSWTVKPITAEYHGVTIRNNAQTVSMGKQLTLSAAVYTTSNVTYSNEFNWSVYCTTGEATINASTGLLTGVSSGRVTITARHRTTNWFINKIFYVTLPTNGYELDYKPILWDYTPVVESTNCYAYAINNQVNPDSNVFFDKTQQMGDYADERFTAFTKDAICAAVQADYAKYNLVFSKNLIFREIDKNSVCPAGTYKVALVVGIDYSNGVIDYHWYRQNSDGLWSHKPGISEVKCVDNSGDLIVDPETADRGFYTNFLGYYAVSPWNNYYSN